MISSGNFELRNPNFLNSGCSSRTGRIMYKNGIVNSMYNAQADTRMTAEHISKMVLNIDRGFELAAKFGLFSFL
jgi:hypothetical protein